MDIEKIAEEVHNSWWKEKKQQGFHSPFECHASTKSYGGMFTKICDKCHCDMYPYGHLPENIKEYDRVTVRTVLNAIEKLKEN